ncbi:MAG: hypothetical protein IPN27_07435 [Cellvibrionales bacterium]|nr:hypothetical protein [Cellvibrionales bacterium]
MIQIKAGDLSSQEQQRLQQIRHNASALSGFVSNFLMTQKPWIPTLFHRRDNGVPLITYLHKVCSNSTKKRSSVYVYHDTIGCHIFAGCQVNTGGID